MPRVDIDALEALERKATPGPLAPSDVFCTIKSAPPFSAGNYENDNAFVAEVRNQLPALLAELKLARAVVEADKAVRMEVVHLTGWTDRFRMAFDDAASKAAAYDAEVR